MICIGRPLSKSIELDTNHILNASFFTDWLVGEMRACLSFAVCIDVASKPK